MRPSPAPKSSTTSSFVVSAICSIRRIIRSGVGTQTESLLGCPTSGAEGAGAWAPEGTGARSSAKTRNVALTDSPWSCQDNATVAPMAKTRRKGARRQSAALAAGCTVLVLLLIVAAFVPRQSSLDAAPPLPARWFDDRARMVSSSFASAKSTYLQSYVLQALRLA